MVASSDGVVSLPLGPRNFWLSPRLPLPLPLPDLEVDFVLQFGPEKDRPVSGCLLDKTCEKALDPIDFVLCLFP